MSEGFFRRWTRLKARGGAAQADPGALAAEARASPDLRPMAQSVPHPPVGPAPAPAGQLPTLADVALLSGDSDFSAFVTQGVDKTVQRLAMKKLFSDPHFNVMDGLDLYIDDYTKADPLPAAMLASMQHAKSIFARFIADDENGKPAPGRSRKDEPGSEPPSQGDA
jgi:hypothetical protein